MRLGAVLCSTFARAGWKVWCHYQRSADEAHALQERLAAEGHTVEPVQADLADATQRADLVDRLRRRLARGRRPRQVACAQLVELGHQRAVPGGQLGVLAQRAGLALVRAEADRDAPLDA